MQSPKHWTPLRARPLAGALRRLRRENALRCENASQAYVFISERGGPISPMGFHHLHLMAKLGKAARCRLQSIRTCCANQGNRETE
jgi:hypothetical protein